MNKSLRDWFIVTIQDGDKTIGKVLHGTITNDPSLRFDQGDYVTTSQIVKQDMSNKLISTANHSCYQLVGQGKETTISSSDFFLLRNGYTPEQIEVIKTPSLLRTLK